MAERQHASIVCPHCGRRSWHPEDVRQRYCGACGFHDQPTKLAPVIPLHRRHTVDKARRLVRLRFWRPPIYFVQCLSCSYTYMGAEGEPRNDVEVAGRQHALHGEAPS